jgi:hypothetical protein
MDPNNDTTSTEAELESFRQRWREEVSARARVAPATPVRTAAPSASKPHVPKSTAPDAASHSHARQRSVEETDEITPYIHRDLGEKQHGRKLDETSAQTAAIASASKEPKTALDHYEKAVERETQGSLGDSVRLYRKAFKVSHTSCEAYFYVLTPYSSTTVCTKSTKRNTFHLPSSKTDPSLSRRSPLSQQQVQDQPLLPKYRTAIPPMHQLQCPILPITPYMVSRPHSKLC